MNGGAPIKAAWPADDRPLSRDSRIALQKNYRRLAIRSPISRAMLTSICATHPRRTENLAKCGRKSDAMFLEKLGVKIP